MQLRYIPITIIIFSLFTTISYGQNEYIDRSFGDNGTVSFDHDFLETYSILGLDSLDNIYISHREVDLVTDITTNKLIKLDNSGEIIYSDRLIDNQDSTSVLRMENSILIRNSLIAESSFIYTHDLNFNLLNRFIIPANVIYSTLTPSSDGGLEGLASSLHNTFFKFGSDGFLDKNFGEDGLIRSEINTSNLHHYFINSTRLKDKSILLSGYIIDTISGYKPCSKLYSRDGHHILDYEADIIAHPNTTEENYYFGYAYNSFQSKDENLLIQGYYQDSLFNFNAYLTKLDINGFIKTNFADNGYLLENPNPGDTSMIKDYCFFIGQFSNGDLMHGCALRDQQRQIYSNYLTLFNENGIKENDFGINGQLSLDSYKGQQFNFYSFFNNQLFIVKSDTIQYIDALGNLNIENTATHITRLNTAKLLDYNPLSPPDASDFNLFPNPTTNRTLIEYNGPNLENISLRIHNLSGQLIIEKIIPSLLNYGQIPIDLKDNAEGIYHLQIIDENVEIWSTKIINIK